MRKSLILCSLFAAASSIAMEMPTNVTRHENKTQLADIDAKQLIDHSGSNFRFYGEYRARKLDGNIFSLPINACDPLPIKNFGSIRYFFLSAIEGNILTPGSAITIEDPSITDMFVVRGKDESVSRCEAYFGYNKNNFKTKGKNKIYTPRLIALNVKALRNIEIRQPVLFESSKYLTCTNMGPEIVKHLTISEDNSWRSEKFQNTLIKLLGGEGWVNKYNELNTISCKEMVLMNAVLQSYKVYWTQQENRLKGITYQHK